MPILNKTNFNTTYNDAATGLFKDNTTRDISEADLRSMVLDMIDSTFFLNTNSTTNITEGAKLFFNVERGKESVLAGTLVADVYTSTLTDTRLVYYDAATRKLLSAPIRRVTSTEVEAVGDLGSSGNLKMVATDATNGQLKQAGATIFHSYGTDNIFFGPAAGNLTLTGVRNIGFGSNALNDLTTGSDCVAVGYYAGEKNTVGIENSFFGVYAGQNNVSGNRNAGFGYHALYSSGGGGSNNSALGYAALNGVQPAAVENVGVGMNAGAGVSVGYNNTFLGSNAGALVTSGHDNIYIGYKAAWNGAIAANFNNIVIGNNISVASADNYFQLATLMYGDLLNNRLGIGTTTVTSKINLPAATDVAGGINFGADVTLYRSAANVLTTDDTFTVTVTGGGKNEFQITSTTANTGITIGADTNLYRSAANTWTTDDSLIIAANLTVQLVAQFANGNAANPTITFASDPDTGIFRSAANTLGFTTTGTEKMKLTSGGGLEILTTTGYLKVPTLTTTQRDALTAAAGMIVFNSTTVKIEGYDGTTWLALH